MHSSAAAEILDIAITACLLLGGLFAADWAFHGGGLWAAVLTAFCVGTLIIKAFGRAR